MEGRDPRLTAAIRGGGRRGASQDYILRMAEEESNHPLALLEDSEHVAQWLHMVPRPDRLQSMLALY